VRGDCRAATDCARGEVCLNQRCSPECASDADCTEGDQRFCRDGRCQPCRDNVDDGLCGAAHVCFGGVCTPGHCHTNVECQNIGYSYCSNARCSNTCRDRIDDGLCPADHLCIGGQCRPGECHDNAGCAAPLLCINNRCLPCREDTQCESGAICIDGECKTGQCRDFRDCADVERGVCNPITHTCASAPATVTYPYRVTVTVDADGKAPLLNPHAWVRIDFSLLLAGLGQGTKVVDRDSIRVTDADDAEVPSRALRAYTSPNDVYLWFWAQGEFARDEAKDFHLYFTTADDPRVAPTYEVLPPPDLVMAYQEETVAVFRGDYRGNLFVETSFPTAVGDGSHNSQALADFDHDGDIDFLQCAYNDWGIYYFENLGGENAFATFAEPEHVADSPSVSHQHCMGAVSGDFDEDGYMDAIVERDSRQAQGHVLLLGQGDGSFDAVTLSTRWGDGPRGMDVGDFDGDGHLDFTYATQGSCEWYVYWGDGAGAFSGPLTHNYCEANNDKYAHAAADFNGDGKIDIITGGAYYGHNNSARRQFENRGERRTFADKGYWPYVNVCPRDNVHGFLKALDFDHDGYDDLVGYMHCDGAEGEYGAYYWRRDAAAGPWKFKRGIRLGPAPASWMGQGSAVPSLGHNLLYKVTVAAAAEPAP
jgi:hypothetical protein